MIGTRSAAPERSASSAGVPATAGRALTGLAVRQVRRSTITVAAVAAGMSGLVAWQYQTTLAGALNGPAMQALAANPAIRTLFGPPVALDDPGGFTVWRTGTPLAVLVGVWALLLATRVTRGEEDAGRWDLLLTGRFRRGDVVLRCLAVIGLAVVLVGFAIDLALSFAGTHPAGAVLHAAGIAGVGLAFAAVGACTAQLLPTRSEATGLSAATLGTALLMRMLADGIDALAWLRWLTPFGLVAETRPYAANHPYPLLVLAAFPLVFGAAALLAAKRRDLGAAVLSSFAPDRRPRTRLLGSPTAFAIRRALRPFTGWGLGVGTYYLVIGALTTSITDFLDDNARFAALAAAAGFSGLGSAAGFAATMFSLLAIPAGLYAATRIAAAASDETSRRAVVLFALPLSRQRLAVSEIAITAAGVLALHIGSGGAFWAGAALVGAPLGAGSALAGALNVAPIALLSLGAAVFALGWVPRAAAAIGALPTAGGFLFDVIARSTRAPEWIVELSPFAHLAAVPNSAPDWASTAGILVAGALLAALGLVGYTRRDLAC